MNTLIEKLVEFRDLQAKREGIEGYKVLQYQTIEKIAKVLPKSLDELENIKGIGPMKLKKYGAAILAMVEEYGGASPPQEEGLGEVIVDNQSSIKYQVSSEHQHSLGPPLTPDLSLRRSEAPPHQANTQEGEEQAKQTISVGEYLEYLNLVFQKTADVKIQGEVTSSKEYPNGIYFSLKDKNDDDVLNCFIPLYTYRGLGIPLEEGMELKVEGIPRMVKRNGRFLFTVENAELAGEGALKKSYDLLKKKLETEGIFARKRELPEFITSVGIITSRSGAVIHDFRNNLAPLGIKLYLKDVRVEGNSAPGMIIEAIKWFNGTEGVKGDEGKTKVDAIVIMRGGGSLEDLQAFNNEQVVRAVFASNIPTIVAIGHDKDIPLAQLAADLEVSTPTAAAHAVSSSWDRLENELPKLVQNLLYQYEESMRTVDNTRKGLENRLFLKWNTLLERFRAKTQIVNSAVTRYMTWVDNQNTLLNKKFEQITARIHHQIQYNTNTIIAAEKVLQQANPERNLKLGYSILRSNDGKIIKSVKEVSVNDTITTQVEDGSIRSRVNKVQ